MNPLKTAWDWFRFQIAVPIEERAPDLDKTAWGAGPWLFEPDLVFWRDKLTRLPCLIRRGPVGALCGYVGVGRRHPMYGLKYGDCCLPGARPRGLCEQDFEGFQIGDTKLPPLPPSMRKRQAEQLVCAIDGEEYCGHTAEAILNCHGGITYANDWSGSLPAVFKTWWFGFDTAHCDDYAPQMVANMKHYEETIPDFPKGPGLFERGEYRELWYVKHECADLAKQLWAFHKTYRAYVSVRMQGAEGPQF